MGDLSKSLTRRDFMKTSAGTAISLAALGSASSRAFAAGSDTMRVGVIGCGGRGSGAANNCVASSDGVEIVALADAFGGRLTGLKNKFKIPDERCFVWL